MIPHRPPPSPDILELARALARAAARRDHGLEPDTLAEVPERRTPAANVRPILLVDPIRSAG